MAPTRPTWNAPVTAREPLPASAVERAFARDGLFAGEIRDYAPRDVQVRMATAVERALADARPLVVEAGTGTGKTLAYLVPVLQAGVRTIVSTGTRNLQNQLFTKDLPLARRALGVNTRVALLKGRRNYLCPYRLELNLEADSFETRQQARDLQVIAEWSLATRSGDCGELHELAEDSAAWSLATSTTDNCLGRDCPRVDDCPVLRARREAAEADLVVVNHHLLFADAVLRGDGFGEILPEADAFVLDEAHQVPETAADFFGESVTARQLNELASDTLAEALRDAADDRDLRQLSEAVERGVADLRLALGTQVRREAWEAVAESGLLQRSVDVLRSTLSQLGEALELAAPRGRGLASCSERAESLRARLDTVLGDCDESGIRWFETWTRSFAVHVTPASTAEPFRELMERRGGTWIFTSATLAVGDDFSLFAGELGIDTEDCETLRLESPFDYEKQALLYIPRGMPDPGDADYTRAVCAACIPVLEASHGRAFILFTSHRALQVAADELRERIPFPMFVQGECGKATLLERFLASDNAVLLATGSYWEGVEVRGDAESCVIIDRLPFASPGEPVLRARLSRLRARGLDPFHVYQLPRAVISLKQGVGRLIRDAGDRGVLMVADPRLPARHYGAVFLDALPRMPRTRELDRVRDFFATEEVAP